MRACENTTPSLGCGRRKRTVLRRTPRAGRCGAAGGCRPSGSRGRARSATRARQSRSPSSRRLTTRAQESQETRSLAKTTEEKQHEKDSEDLTAGGDDEHDADGDGRHVGQHEPMPCTDLALSWLGARILETKCFSGRVVNSNSPRAVSTLECEERERESSFRRKAPSPLERERETPTARG